MKRFPIDQQPEQDVPIVLDQLTRQQWLFELELASDHIEARLMSTYRGLSSLFVRLSSRWLLPGARKRIEEYLERRVTFPLINNLQIKGSYHLLKRFSHELLYTAVRNISIATQVRETSKLVNKKIQESKLQKALRDVNNFGRGGNGFGRAA